MNEKSNLVFVVSLIIALAVGAIAGYSTSTSIGSRKTAKLTAEYDAAKRERDTALDRIAEDNRRLRNGIERAELELKSATVRATRLEEYIGRAGIRNQEIIASADGARQNLEEAIRIVGSYLNPKQAPEAGSDSGDTGGGRGRDTGGLGDE